MASDKQRRVLAELGQIAEAEYGPSATAAHYLIEYADAGASVDGLADDLSIVMGEKVSAALLERLIAAARRGQARKAKSLTAPERARRALAARSTDSSWETALRDHCETHDGKGYLDVLAREIGVPVGVIERLREDTYGRNPIIRCRRCTEAVA